MTWTNRLSATLVTLACVAAACGGTTGSGGASSPELAPSVASATPATAASPSPGASAVPALVGSWLGEHQCQRIVDMFTTAGMEAQVLPNIVGNGLLPGVDSAADVDDPANPCVGAVPVKHSHFFTAAGEFGSRDERGEQVDEGRWTTVDEDTFAIGDSQFRYRVEGDALRMEPVTVGTCPPTDAWCPAAWELMVAMPGMAWTREP